MTAKGDKPEWDHLLTLVIPEVTESGDHVTKFTDQKLTEPLSSFFRYTF